jgi:hypothetical protein
MKSQALIRFPLSFCHYLSAGKDRNLTWQGLVISLIMMVSCNSGQPTQQATGPASAPGPTPLTSSHGSSAGIEKVFGSLKFNVPTGWVEQNPSSPMRKGQFGLPKADGDTTDAELVVFYFGAGQGGSVEANIDRWIGQISQPDGSSSKEKAKTSKKTVAGLPVTLVDVNGTYQPLMMPGGGQQVPNAGYRMMAAVVETTEGPWFFKLVGPEKTVAKWASSFDQFINSLQKS